MFGMLYILNEKTGYMNQLSAQNSQREYQSKALQHLKTAHQLDPNDYLIAYHLSLLNAQLRELKEALKYAELSLQLNKEHTATWTLLALLLSALKEPHTALRVCRTAAKSCPDRTYPLLHSSYSLL
jgi:tetratricopeptide (TPR) repeat protein